MGSSSTCAQESNLRPSPVRIRDARADETALVRELFQEYAGGIGIDLGFQDFNQELAALPGYYPAILLGELDGRVVGCAAMRQLDSATAELK
jgi:hypothetical protein